MEKIQFLFLDFSKRCYNLQRLKQPPVERVRNTGVAVMLHDRVYLCTKHVNWEIWKKKLP